jgi:hypothetical protein
MSAVRESGIDSEPTERITSRIDEYARPMFYCLFFRPAGKKRFLIVCGENKESNLCYWIIDQFLDCLRILFNLHRLDYTIEL